MQYFRVKNLEKLQHYKKDTKPVWIKLYANILHDAKLNSLTEREQLFWIKLLLYSSQNSNRIPFKSKLVSDQIHMKSLVNLELFVDLGMIELIEVTDKKSIVPLEPNKEYINQDIKNINQKDKTPQSGKPDPQDALDYLNLKANRQFKLTPKHLKCINARIKEGYSLKEFQKVVDTKIAEWGSDGERMQYLRPITLFGTKMDSYLNQPNGNGTRNWDNVKKEEIPDD